MSLLLLPLLAAPGSPQDERRDLRLPALFSDGMVLQRDLACPVWGWAAPGEEVAVSIASQSKSTQAGPDGRWRLKLDPLPAGGPHELSVKASSLRTVRNVLVGEVWIAVGASNLELPVKSTKGLSSEVDGAGASPIRLFKVPLKSADAPREDVGAAWSERRPEAVSDFSAIAYFFGRSLQERIRVPIGLIQVSAENSRAEHWGSPQDFESNPELRAMLMSYRMGKGNFDGAMTLYHYKVMKAREEGRPPPDESLTKPAPIITLGAYYHAMLAPLIPYGIRGAIWCQGEENVRTGRAHAATLATLIRGWRSAWGQGEFPLVALQLSSFGAREEEPRVSLWAEIRECQSKAFAGPALGLVVSADLNEAGDLVPRNKVEVGQRLAAWADARVYGKESGSAGPELERVSIEEDRLRVVFASLGGGLQVHGERLAGFAVAGDDKIYQWAEARIDGPSVVVWSAKVPKPVAVRYGWSDHPELTLFSRDGWPASPFRWESWPAEEARPRRR